MATITEDYVSFQVARLLKEKGFNIPCGNCYDSSGKTPNESVYGGANIETLDYNADPFVKSGFPKLKTFSAPTLQMAMKWLREVHKIFITILFIEDTNYFAYTIENLVTKKCLSTSKDTPYNNYEEACEAAIKYCLENLI